jgi:hypothetical protein
MLGMVNLISLCDDRLIQSLEFVAVRTEEFLHFNAIGIFERTVA